MLELRNISKRFGDKQILSDFNLTIHEGNILAIVGPSGGGKTTLLRMLAGLETIDSGEVFYNGEPLALDELTKRQLLGFVFQDFNLLETLSVYDNIVLPLVLARRPIAEMEQKVKPIAEMLGISDLLKKYPYELSGGQQQRVAIGRAMITDPSLLLADEPTGALDSKSASNTLDLFDKINENGQTILMVTHSTVAASRAKRVLFIKDGLIYNQLYRGERSDQQMFELISETLTVMANRGEAHV